MHLYLAISPGPWTNPTVVSPPRRRGPGDARLGAGEHEDPGADAGADAQQRQLRGGQTPRQLAVLPRVKGWDDGRDGDGDQKSCINDIQQYM